MIDDGKQKDLQNMDNEQQSNDNNILEHPLEEPSSPDFVVADEAEQCHAIEDVDVDSDHPAAEEYNLRAEQLIQDDADVQEAFNEDAALLDSAEAIHAELEMLTVEPSGSEQAGADNQDSQPHYYTKVKDTSHGGKKPHKVFAYVAAVVLVAALSIGGGYLGAEISNQKMEENLTASINELLDSAGSTVMYRTVDTKSNVVGSNDDLSVAEVASLCADSVVEIKTETTVSGWNFFGNSSSYLMPGAGSGTIISEDGYILTCNHVIADVESITVVLSNGESYQATVVATDPTSDVAILKIEADGLTAAVLGNSEELVVGDDVVAIGNPLGELGGSVTNGVISALDREVTIEDQGTFNVLQTNAAINGGNSGGGLFNMRGELIGMVNAKAKDIGVEGLAFALPIDDIKPVIEDLLTHGYVTDRAVKLGVSLLDVADERTAAGYGLQELGCYILSVNASSNAEYAGLKSGDLIISVDGQDIENSDQVIDLIATKKAGDVLEMMVKRNGQLLKVEVTMYAVVPDQNSATSGQNS